MGILGKLDGGRHMIQNGWYYCSCGQKLFQVRPETRCYHFVAYCKRCKRESLVSFGEETCKGENRDATGDYRKRHAEP